MSDSVRLHRRQPNRLPGPRDSPGKNTGVQIDFRAVRDLTDKESTKGVTGSIREFFNKWHFDRYDLTVIKIENNMITEVYFDF